MRLLPTIKDTRGRESHTLLFVAMAFFAILYRFIFDSPHIDLTTFATAFTTIMAVWLGREWTEKK